METLHTLSDEELLHGLAILVGTQREILARMIVFLREIEDRRLHLLQGYSSLFDFCTSRLQMSEGEAFRRITAARLARRFPVVVALVKSGALHLSGLVLLRNHLTEANHAELFRAASHESKRRIEWLLAARFPRPDVPSSIRKLPMRPARSPSQEPATDSVALSGSPGGRGGVAIEQEAETECRGDGERGDGERRDGERGDGERGDGEREAHRPEVEWGGEAERRDSAGARKNQGMHAARAESAKPAHGRRDGRVEPLSAARYRVQLTVSQELRDKIERARNLMSHQNPGGDLAPIVERAMELLLLELEKTRLGKTARPRKSTPPPKRGPVSRAARRTVFERDGEQCSFVAPGGQRCSARAFLEVDHVMARARGGSGESPNLRVLCHAHNQLSAEQTFGRQHVQQSIHLRRERTERRGKDRKGPERTGKDRKGPERTERPDRDRAPG